MYDRPFKEDVVFVTHQTFGRESLALHAPGWDYFLPGTLLFASQGTKYRIEDPANSQTRIVPEQFYRIDALGKRWTNFQWLGSGVNGQSPFFSSYVHGPFSLDLITETGLWSIKPCIVPESGTSLIATRIELPGVQITIASPQRLELENRVGSDSLFKPSTYLTRKSGWEMVPIATL